MNNPLDNNYDPLARKLLEKLRPVAERDESVAARGRQRFLHQASLMAGEVEQVGHPRLFAQQAVSQTPSERLKGWIATATKPFTPKERNSMATIFTSVFVILALLLGGSGATVYAAQDSQPDGLLYPVKTLSEDVRLSLSTDSNALLDLALSFTNRRIDEAAAMKMMGRAIPEEVFQRYQDHLRLAYQLAADMDEDGLDEAINKIRSNLRDQDRVMSMTRPNIPDHVDPVLARVEATVRNQIRVLENDIEVPLELQFSLRQRMRMMSEEDNDLTEGPYQFQHGEGEPSQAGEGQMQPGEPDPQDGSGSQHGPGPGSEDPGSGKSSDMSGPQDRGPGTGYDHNPPPKTPQKNSHSGGE